MNIHLLSPLLYILFVKSFDIIEPIPKSTTMKFCLKLHNIFLSFLSLLMLMGIIYGNYITGKLDSYYNLLCLPYNNNEIVHLFYSMCLYSKYIEWGDTLFLHLSGKKITMLQYTHHMSTAILIYCNSIDFITSTAIIPMGINCLVHIPMYWYFAYPKGFLYKYRKIITKSQIIQHIIVLITQIHAYTLDNCNYNQNGSFLGLFLYLMYLGYFLNFYIQKYLY